jgi:hypothetical protein
MSEDAKSHQLYKQVDEAAGIYRDVEPYSNVQGGWVIVQDDATAFTIAHREYIDLSGWSREDLTMFVRGVDIQKSQIPFGNAPITHEYDILSTRRLTDAELGNNVSLPGFLPNTCDLMNIIYGERMTYASNAQIPGTFVQVSGDTFGSGNPTAMDKLHWTRLIISQNMPSGGLIAVHPTNLVVQAITLEEKDLVYIERLRRSYVLQDEADV